MADLKFELVTPDRLVMSDDVYMVVRPTSGRAELLAEKRGPLKFSPW